MISIIIPVYNHAAALRRALVSIERQTYTDIEVIVVDDGSEIAIRLQPSDFSKRPKSEVRSPKSVLIRQEHAGAPAARNRGFRESKGEYVIFWDADVIGKTDMLEKMLTALQAHPEASYAYADYIFGWKKMTAGSFNPAQLKKMNYIMTTSLMRRGAFPGFDETLKRFQDWDLWLTLLEQKKIGVYIPEILFSVIPHKGGISHWLPSFAYKAPWRWLPGVRPRVRAYEVARKRILDKFAKIK